MTLAIQQLHIVIIELEIHIPAHLVIPRLVINTCKTVYERLSVLQIPIFKTTLITHVLHETRIVKSDQERLHIVLHAIHLFTLIFVHILARLSVRSIILFNRELSD